MNTDELAEHLFDSALGALDILTVHLGSRFGLYDLLHQRARTSAELADAAGIQERYAREWLEQQAVAGFVDVDDPDQPFDQRRYSVSDEHAAVLGDQDSLTFFAPFADVISAAAVQLPEIADAFRSGGGVAWSEYGEVMRKGQADANRPLFLHLLGSDWLPSLPDVHRALSAGGRVADIGCGDGWSSIGIGLSYPTATVDGFDVDKVSVDVASGHAAAYGLENRVRFHHLDAADAPGAGEYDLVTAFECIHDMPDPVSVLAGARRLVREGGTVLVMDERVPERFTGRSGDAIEQLMYGMSVLICLPDGLSHGPSVGTGTVMRPAKLEEYAVEAGFADVEILPIEHEVFRFYRLVA